MKLVRMEDGGWRMDAMHHGAEEVRARGDARPPGVEVGGAPGQVDEEGDEGGENCGHDREEG